MNAVDVSRVVVTFVNVNMNVNVVGCKGVRLTMVVTVAAIGLIAGAPAGTRTTSATRVTQAITRTLITSCLFNIVPSRC